MKVKPIALFVVFFGFVFSTTGQNPKIVDSLHHLLVKKSGGDRFPMLYELAFQHLDRDNEKALMFISKAEDAALQSGDSLWIVKSKRVKGQILYRLERLEEAIMLLERAMTIATRNEYVREEEYIAAALGTSYIFKSSLAEALEYTLRSWGLGKQHKNEVDWHNYLNNIGVTYYKLGDFDKALKYYIKAYELRNLSGADRANLLVNIVLCYSYLGEFGKARVYLEMIPDECGEGCSRENLMHFKFAAGLYYYKSEILDSAEANFRISLRYAEALNDQRMISDNIYFLTDVYLGSNALVRAKPLVHRAMELAEDDHAFPETRLHAYKRLSEYLLKSHRFRDAASYQAKYIELNDSVYSQEYTVRLMAKEVEFAQRQNTARIEAQAEALRLNKEIVARQKVVNMLTSALVLIVLIVLALLFRNFQRKKATNALLEQKVRERTQELEINRSHLANKLKEQQFAINRASVVLIDKFNTVKGLCLTGHKEATDHVVDRYFFKIDETSQDMQRYLQKLFAYLTN